MSLNTAFLNTSSLIGRLSRSTDARERSEAALALAEVGDPAAVPALLDALQSADSMVQRNVRLALSAFGTAAVPGLVKLLRSPDVNVRWEAAEALRSIRSPEAAPALVDALGDPDAGVRWVAAEALMLLGRAALEPLFAGLVQRSTDIWFRRGAHHVLRAYRGTPYETVTRPVLAALDSIEPAVEAPVAADRALVVLQAHK